MWQTLPPTRAYPQTAGAEGAKVQGPAGEREEAAFGANVVAPDQRDHGLALIGPNGPLAVRLLVVSLREKQFTVAAPALKDFCHVLDGGHERGEPCGSHGLDGRGRGVEAAGGAVVNWPHVAAGRRAVLHPGKPLRRQPFRERHRAHDLAITTRVHLPWALQLPGRNVFLRLA